MSELFTVMDLKKYFWASLFLAIICLAGAVLAVMSSGDANMFKTTVTGFGDLDVREYAPDDSVSVTAMATNATANYLSLIEWGQIVKFANSFEVFGAQESGGFRNQYLIRGQGSGDTFEYRATAIVGDFVGGGELILRGFANPDKDGNTLEARITLDASGGRSIFDIDVTNVSTNRPVDAFTLKGVGNWTFQQYLLLNQTMQEQFSEEDFCESLDRILPRDFSGVYIAPHGKKLTANADLVADDATVEPAEVSVSMGRFAEEQAMMDDYRLAHPDEFEEEEEIEAVEE